MVIQELSQEVIRRVRQLADPILFEGGFELVDIEYRREARGWVLRLYVEKKGGITLEDCARISREIGRILDVEDFLINPYTLEVSSPGLNRALKSEKDFVKYRERLIRVVTTHPIENRRHFKGRLRRVEPGEIEVEVDGAIFRIPLSEVAKANLEIEF